MINKNIIFIFFIIFICLTITLFVYFLTIIFLKKKIRKKLIITNNLINEFKQKWCWIYLEFAKKIFKKINSDQNIDIKIIIETIQKFILDWNKLFLEQNKKMDKNISLFLILKMFFYINKNKNVFYSIYNKLDEVINLQTLYCVQELNENFFYYFEFNNVGDDQLKVIKTFLVSYLSTDDKVNNYNYQIIKKNIEKTTNKSEINKLISFINLENKKVLDSNSKISKNDEKIYELLKQQKKALDSFTDIKTKFRQFINKDFCEPKN